MISHAIVRFEEDGRLVYYVTHVNNIADFSPKFAQDFDRDKRDYMVKWQGSMHGADDSFSGRWAAEIVILGVSEEEAKFKFKSRFPKLRITGKVPDLFLSNSGKTDGMRRKRRSTGEDKNGNLHPGSGGTAKTTIPVKTASVPTQISSQERNDHGCSRSQSSQRNAPNNRSTDKSTSTSLQPVQQASHSKSPAQANPSSNHAKEQMSSQVQSHPKASHSKSPGQADPSSAHAKEQGDVTKSPEYEALQRQQALLKLRMQRLLKQGSSSACKGQTPDKTAVTFDKDAVVTHDASNFSNEHDFNQNDESGMDTYEDDDNNEVPNGNKSPPSKSPTQDHPATSDESDEENTTNRVYRDLKGEELLKAGDTKKVYIGQKCAMKHNFYNLKVRTANSNSRFVRFMAQGLWGQKKCSRRTLTGKTRGSVPKKKATPRKVACVMAAFKGYLKHKEVPPACHDTLLKQARIDLCSKLGDSGRDNDPEYRTKVKTWNAERKAKRQAAREVEEPSSESDNSEVDDALGE